MVSPVNFVSNVKQTLTNYVPLEIVKKLMMILMISGGTDLSSFNVRSEIQQRSLNF